MKSFLPILLTLCLSVGICHAQNRYKTTMGQVNINASTPLEDIDALNTTANAILDPATGNFAVVLLVKEFEFDRKLMQEHFNENYMESDKYPKAIFSGTLQDFEPDFMDNLPADYDLNGKLTIHGITRPLKTIVRLSRKENLLILESEFMVASEDHGIEVPRLVFKKIAREVQVRASLELFAQ